MPLMRNRHNSTEWGGGVDPWERMEGQSQMTLAPLGRMRLWCCAGGKGKGVGGGGRPKISNPDTATKWGKSTSANY